MEDQVEDTDWAPHEDSAPSTEDYNSQSGEEFDGINSSSTARKSHRYYMIIYKLFAFIRSFG